MGQFSLLIGLVMIDGFFFFFFLKGHSTIVWFGVEISAIFVSLDNKREWIKTFKHEGTKSKLIKLRGSTVHFSRILIKSP